MRFLLFVNLVFYLLVGCFPDTVLAKSHQPDPHFWLPQLRDSVQKNSYRIVLSTDKVSISGIWIVKYVDESWRGTLINEFGMKMFDFICTPRGCELKNVVVMVNKWYIKKTIAEDVLFMLEVDHPNCKMGRAASRSQSSDTLTVTYKKKKMLQRFASGEMVMYNKKRNLTYSFKKM